MDSTEESQAALASALKTWKSMGITSEHQANYLIAKNVADEEMGRYGEHPVCTEKLNPRVVMVKSTQDGVRTYETGSMNRPRDRRIFV